MINLYSYQYLTNNRSLRQAFFSKRYELFVEGREWKNLKREDGLDIDQYDNSDTSYIINSIDDEIVGGTRLRPTTVPHMLKEKFSFLCYEEPPVGLDVFECSRIFVARRHPQRRKIFCEILHAAAKFCVVNDITKLTGITETWQLNSYLACGLQATPLGMPQEVNGMNLLAVEFEVDKSVLNNLKMLVDSL